MREKISQSLRDIEQSEDIKIIYACESGSRAWGFPSKDSDYDVRFIYIRPLKWYLTIDEGRDVIERPISDLLDINGWDIKKTLKLLRKSNPPLVEWLSSPIVYEFDEEFTNDMKTLIESAFSSVSATHHYLNMAKGNNRDYLQQDIVRIKKYFYVLRPILACMWIQKYQSAPPILFQTLIEDLLEDGEVKNQINQLLRKKKQGEELDRQQKISCLNEFIAEKITEIEDALKNLSHEKNLSTHELNEFFLSTLNRIWPK
ncbi:nucleotidyltransferase domain-containing protein [Metabacillus herbersteinensis]|uniref:Nucleotidyltransferase domain-containing protein n=1 Tax=Metabacillus herbersteinensis TaxID=283816 RepID=A0ABV6GFP2_9BACI